MARYCFHQSTFSEKQGRKQYMLFLFSDLHVNDQFIQIVYCSSDGKWLGYGIGLNEMTKSR